MQNEVLFSKMFVGSYNDDNIGHEVINFFKPDNSENSFLYIPPYGNISEKLYRNIKHVVLLGAPVRYAYPVIAIATNVKCFENDDDRKKQEDDIKYCGVSVNKINYTGTMPGDPNWFLTYIVAKDSIKCPLKEDKYYVVPKSDNKFSEEEHKSVIEKLEKNGGKVLDVEVNPQRKYTSCLCVEYLEKVIENWDVYPLKTVEEAKKEVSNYKDDNFLNFCGKTNDEIVFSNMICNILNHKHADEHADAEYRQKFVREIFGVESSIDFSVEKEVLSLTKSQRLIKQYFGEGNSALKEQAKKKLKDCYGIDIALYKENPFKKQNGRIDLLIKNNEKIIVVENKIKSSINGIFEDGDEIKNQLDKYKEYIRYYKKEETEYSHAKDTYFIFAPVYNSDFDILGCKIITYDKLVKFFEKNKIPDCEFFDEFLNGLKKHSLTRQQEITRRFINVLKQK